MSKQTVENKQLHTIECNIYRLQLVRATGPCTGGPLQRLPRPDHAQGVRHDAALIAGLFENMLPD